MNSFQNNSRIPCRKVSFSFLLILTQAVTFIFHLVIRDFSGYVTSTRQGRKG